LNTEALLPLAHEMVLVLVTVHGPLLDVRVKPAPLAAAVNPAQVPPTYQVPALIMQPVLVPLA